MEITSKVKQKIEMQSKAEKNAKLKGKKRENNVNSNASIRNKSAKCKF
jgi:transposase